MLLKILKSNQLYNLILFPVIGITLWSYSLISPGGYNFAPGEDQTILFSPILNLFPNKYFVQVVSSLFILIFIGFLIQQLNNKYAFYRVRTLLPSNLIIILISGLSGFHVLHPIYFAAIFFAFAIEKVFSSFEKKSVLSISFDSGILIGIGSLFYINLIFLTPAFLFGIRIMNHECKWRDYILIFLGLLIPWVFTFSAYYLFDNVGELLGILETNIISVNRRLASDLPLKIYSASWMIILTIASLTVVSNFDKKKISTRKYYSVYILLVLFIIVLYFVSPFVSVEILILLAIPSTYIITDLLLTIKSRLLGNLILLIIIGLAIFMQVSNTLF